MDNRKWKEGTCQEKVSVVVWHLDMVSAEKWQPQLQLRVSSSEMEMCDKNMLAPLSL
jgi:hypothetical protein